MHERNVATSVNLVSPLTLQLYQLVMLLLKLTIQTKQRGDRRGDGILLDYGYLDTVSWALKPCPFAFRFYDISCTTPTWAGLSVRVLIM